MQKSMKLMEEAGMTELKVFQLDESMQLGPQLFDHQLEFSAKCQSVLPFGVVLYNEKGNFSLVELNQSLSQGEEGVALQTVLSNPGNNYRVSIAEVRMHRNMLNFYLCCTHGYVYLFDRLSKRIKYHVRAAQSPVLDLLLIKQDSELIAL